MVCRHGPGDRDCSKNGGGYRSDYPTPTTPDASRYEVVEAQHVPETNRLVLKVKYPNCANCAYEGTKVLVYENVSPLDALKWKKIDPHFADPKRHSFAYVPEAPSPIARFPASTEGWRAALWFAAKFT